jgi:UDP-N-acetylglucosamine 2-epimerase (non-hydrolysing)
LKDTIAIILGTRPEIIKLYPVLKSFEKKNIKHFLIHTGQHYSFKMDKIFFAELGLSSPQYRINVGSGSHALQTAAILTGVERILNQTKPKIALVQGDTNSTLGGALAAVKLGIQVAHVEAGLRSFDFNMPEEINRVLVDRISKYLFAPTSLALKNLKKEGMSKDNIHLTGNTIVDVIKSFRPIACKKSTILDMLGLKSKQYFLATVHRQENSDNPERLKEIIQALSEVSERFSMPVIFPVHPRTWAKLDTSWLKSRSNIKFIEPLGFIDFIRLESECRLVLTDSGGVQEESCILKVPCVTLRYNTERQETLQIGCNVLAGTRRSTIVEATAEMLGRRINWKNPFGDGNAGERITDIISRLL